MSFSSETFPMLALIGALLAPLPIAVLFVLPRFKSFGLALAPWAAAPALCASVIVPVGTLSDVPWLFLGGRLGIDALVESDEEQRVQGLGDIIVV